MTGVDGCLDGNGDLRDDAQEAAHLVSHLPLVRGQLLLVVAVPPELLHAGLLQLEQPGHHFVLAGPPARVKCRQSVKKQVTGGVGRRVKDKGFSWEINTGNK